MKSNGIRFGLFVIILILLLNPSLAEKASASPGPLLSCRFETSRLNVGEKTELVVEVSDIADFYAYQFEMRFPGEQVKLIDGDEASNGINFRLGELLAPDFVVLNAVDIAGKAQLALTQVNPSPARSGSGWLARIEVEAVKAGAVPFTFNNVILANTRGDVIAIDLQGCVLEVVAIGAATAEFTATPLPTYPAETLTPALSTATPDATATAGGQVLVTPEDGQDGTGLVATTPPDPLATATSGGQKTGATAVANLPLIENASQPEAQVEPAAEDNPSTNRSTELLFIVGGTSLMVVVFFIVILWVRARQNRQA